MTTTTAPAPQLTATDARRLIARARDAAVTLDGLLLALWNGRGHVALNYPNTAAGWRACCADNLPQLATFALRPEPRDELARALHRGGASVGVIAGALGVSKSTAHGALRGMTDRPATVTSADGRVRSSRGACRDVSRGEAPAPAAPARPFVVQLVTLLAERGPLTAAEVEDATGRRHGAVSAALHRLTSTGRLTYHPGPRRGHAGRYAVPTVAGCSPSTT